MPIIHVMHKTTLTALVAIGFLICAVGSPRAAFPENSIEIDLDGVLGNGPDTLLAAVGDTVEADIWIVPAPPPGRFLILFVIPVCEQGGGLTFESGTVQVDWDTVFVATAESCASFGGYDLSFDILDTPPFLAASSRYVVTGASSSHLSVDLENSEWDDDDFDIRQFDSFVGAVVQVNTTATTSVRWGQLKELFR